MSVAAVHAGGRGWGSCRRVWLGLMQVGVAGVHAGVAGVHAGGRGWSLPFEFTSSDMTIQRLRGTAC